jgi:hypothetical protein
MDIFKIVLSFFSMVGLGMAGGQGKIGGKNTRRFGLPIVAWLTAFKFNGFKWQDLALFLLIPVLCMGYGVDSQLGAAVGHVEWLIRAVYAFLLSLPFLAYGWVKWGISAVLLVVAFQIQAGSLGYAPWFGDFLIEDIIRYGTLAVVILGNVLIRKK